jgi:hypothetical protein
VQSLAVSACSKICEPIKNLTLVYDPAKRPTPRPIRLSQAKRQEPRMNRQTQPAVGTKGRTAYNKAEAAVLVLARSSRPSTMEDAMARE